LIVADDLGWGDVGFNGRTDWNTPRLDQLAAEGLRLTRCYTAATVCAPSRAAFLTGKYTIHSGVSRNNEDLPTEEVTIAEALKPLGYSTALFGKWHHGEPRSGRTEYVHPMDQGFEEFFGFTDAVHAWEKFPAELWRGREKVAVSGYVDDLVTDKAIDFISRSKEKPFFLDLSFVAPHFKVEAPKEEIAKHQGKFAETDPRHPTNATYAAMVTRLDFNVGRIVDALDRNGLSRKTMIVFVSDHGATFEGGNRGASATLDSNRPFRGQKRTLWEGGIRIPAVVRWPERIPAGKEHHEVVHLIDLFPTFVNVAGGTVDPAWHVDGIDQLPVWRQERRAAERTVFWEWRTEGENILAAMRGNFKLVVVRGGKPELYNVVDDPAERRDVSAQYSKLTRELNQELRSWLATEVKR
jgi:arylsulfatase A-like enzyme